MKRAVAGLFILLCLASTSSISALGCHNCTWSGYACGTLGCVETYRCTATDSFCSLCWENCYESPEGYCGVSRPCQWAGDSEDKGAFPTETAWLSSLAP
jgi:hypothetical protein